MIHEVTEASTNEPESSSDGHPGSLDSGPDARAYSPVADIQRKADIELLATRTMAWTRQDTAWLTPDGRLVETWDPFGNSTDALALAEQLRSKGWLVIIKLIPHGLSFQVLDSTGGMQSYQPFACELHWKNVKPVEHWRRLLTHRPVGIGPSLEEAITLAALEEIKLWPSPDEG